MNENTNERLADANISTKEFLEKVEEAAREGAKQGSKGARGGISPFELLKTLILIALIAGVGWMVFRFRNFTGDLKDIVSREVPVEERDLTLENHGILGYTAADFQEAILGDSQQLKKLEVFKQDVVFLDHLREKGKTIVVVDHSEYAERFFARIITLHNKHGVLVGNNADNT